jgi:hypothetical protein
MCIAVMVKRKELKLSRTHGSHTCDTVQFPSFFGIPFRYVLAGHVIWIIAASGHFAQASGLLGFLTEGPRRELHKSVLPCSLHAFFAPVLIFRRRSRWNRQYKEFM